MPKIRVGDIDMHYEQRGEGFPLLLIMGFCGSLYWWPETLVDRFARDYRVIRFDNRGAGLTDVPERGYTIRNFARDTAGLMDALGVERAHVFGISMGGMIAQMLTLNHGERVERLVLGCTNCGPLRGPFINRYTLRGWARLLTHAKSRKRGFTPSMVFAPGFLERRPEIYYGFVKAIKQAPISRAGRRRQMRALVRFDSYRRLPEIEKPTLVITGDKDAIVPPRNSRIIARRIPDARLTVLENAGHAFMAEKPDETYHAVVEHLTGGAPKPNKPKG